MYKMENNLNETDITPVDLANNSSSSILSTMMNVINKYNITLDDNTSTKIINILQYISTATGSNVSIFENIKDEINLILADGKIDAYDILPIIRIITEILNTGNITSLITGVNIFDIKYIVKILIYTFIELKVINTSNISSVIDHVVENATNTVDQYFILPYKNPDSKSCWQTFLDYLAKLGIKF